ncbi:hypothetical protein F5I97DRAFT_437113 [Phlebopus sp. FC_14]|nr:hypothetical protein F5I97DRAFT_437113 [Phlebopus sp. FC_14]
MLKPEPSSIIAIAIAFAALKHKPRDQSTASYVLDLQAKFPLEPIHSGYGEETQGGPSSQPEADKWRAHALELEKELEALKAQRGADQDELEKLRHDVSQKRAVDAPTDAPPKKKTKKISKEATSNEWKWSQLRADWSSFLDSQYPPPPSVFAAYTSLRGALVSLSEDKPTYVSHLTDAITRTFKVLHAFLFSGKQSSSVLSSSNTLAQPPPPTAHKNLNSARMAMASPLLMYILQTCLPALLDTHENSKYANRPAYTDPHRKNIDVVLDQLLELVLLPLLRSFVPLSHHHLEPLITLKKAGRDKGKGKEKEAEAGPMSNSRSRPLKRLTEDTRRDSLTLLGEVLRALELFPRPNPASYLDIAADVRERLALETIRELEALYSVPSQSSPQPPSQSPSEPQPQSHSPPCPAQTSGGTAAGDNARMKGFQKSREERVRALAVKSAGWYLCSVLSLCVPSTRNEDCEGSRSRNQVSLLLTDALVGGIGRLVRSVVNVDADQTDEDKDDGQPTIPEHDKSFQVDAVCRGMLLAVCERAMGIYTEI